MKFCIRVWSENTVVLMTESGHVLSYFKSVSEALDACSQWYDCNTSELKHDVGIQHDQMASSDNTAAAYI